VNYDAFVIRLIGVIVVKLKLGSVSVSSRLLR